VLLAGCGESPLDGSDERLVHIFRTSQNRLSKLIKMAEQDHAQVLWFKTHELEPSDALLPAERWEEYDQTLANTGVRKLERSDAAVEMDVDSASTGFMQEAAVIGFLYSAKQPAPIVSSLKDGIPQTITQAGGHVAYKQLAANWYLVFRQE
jgi:hypothetical protein